MNSPAPEEDTTVPAGELVCKSFQARGVNTAFCLSGAAHTFLLREMQKCNFNIISTRTEACTVAAADGYARAKGGFGIAMVVGKQGLPNTIGAVRTAQMACSPVVLLASVYEGISQESMDEEPSDQLAMVRPYTKWARIVPSAERLDEFINAAIHQATTGRPGVAVVGIPIRYPDALIKKSTSASTHKGIPAAPAPNTNAIEQAAKLIQEAQRPLILVGSGAAMAEAGDEIRSLADMGLPVFGHALGRGIVPEDLEAGFPWPLAQVAAKSADVVIALGIRLSQRIGFGMAPRFSPTAKFIQVDIEEGEIGRTRSIDVPIVSDAKLAAQALGATLKTRHYSAPSRSWINDSIATRLKRIDELGQNTSGLIHPLQIGRELMEKMPENTIFVSDGADIYNWMSGIVCMRTERSFMDHYPLGSMGIGMGLALGAAAASAEIAEMTGNAARPVLLVTGDGSFGYYTAELNSAKLANLPLKCLVANDGAWGTEKNGHMIHLDHPINCELGQCDYHLIGQAYGCESAKISDASELGAALNEMLASQQPYVLNVLTDPDAGLARKKEKSLQMVAFEDLPSSLSAHHVVDLS